jgi:hypothetical protein
MRILSLLLISTTSPFCSDCPTVKPPKSTNKLGYYSHEPYRTPSVERPSVHGLSPRSCAESSVKSESQISSLSSASISSEDHSGQDCKTKTPPRNSTPSPKKKNYPQGMINGNTLYAPYMIVAGTVFYRHLTRGYANGRPFPITTYSREK